MSSNENLSRRRLLETALPAGLAVLGVALATQPASADVKKYPSLREGHAALEEAKKALNKGDDKFGGHREKAIELIDKALYEIVEAAKFADK